MVVRGVRLTSAARFGTCEPMPVVRLLIVALLASVVTVFAAGGVPAPDAPDPLATARGHIAAKRWSVAIEELHRVEDEGSADWNNLMGYAMRKQAPPHLEASERYYAAALRIDPNHRATLEYSGELFLMKGDLPKAEQRLATLEKLCPRSCAESRDLKRAIDRYKAAGNRWVAGGY